MGHRSFVVFVLCCFPLLFASIVAAQSRDTLETRVTAAGDSLTLLWDDKHPWDAELLGRGATLMAEYATKSRGVVAERLSSGRVSGPQSRVITFTLPEHLMQQPTGPVCLSILTASQRMLPVRRPGAHPQDPARFRDLAWEEAAVHQTASIREDSTLHALQESLRVRQAAYDEQRQTAQKRGWTSAEACSTAHATSFALEQKPRDVLPRSEHESVARRVCVSRVARVSEAVDKLLSEPSKLDVDTFKAIADTVQKPALLEVMLDALQKKRPRDTSLQERRAQLRAFTADWKRWAPAADDYTDPPIGTAHDELQVQSLTQGSSERVFALLLHLPNAPQPDAEDIAAFVGGSLESYSRCVVDGQTQLRTKLDSWEQMQRAAPERDARAQQQVQQMCRSEIVEEEQRAKEISSLEARVSEESARLSSEHTSISIPRTVQVLNQATCRLDDALSAAPGSLQP